MIASVLAAGVALGALATLAHAQEAELRGDVRDDQVNNDLLGQTQFPLDPPPAAQDDPFADEPTEARRPRVSSSNDTAGEEDDQATAAAATPAQDAEEADLAVMPTGSIGSAERMDFRRAQRESARAEPIQGIDRQPEETPFGPLGMRVGTFNVITTLEQGLTATDNASYSSNPSSAILSESALRLNAASDWSRHSAQINAYGNYRKSISGEEVDEPTLGIDGTLNLDFAGDYRGIGRLGYNLQRESASSPVSLPSNVSRPIRHEFTGSAALEKDLGKLRFSATGGFDRLAYGDASVSGGGSVSQRERDLTRYYGTLRTGYQVSPALTPFVELEVGRRLHDMRRDSAGYARSSNELSVAGGVELDLGEKLRGEISAGWLSEDFDDSRLTDISGLTTNAAIVWSPQRGTTVNLDASTTVEGTTTAGESGSLYYGLRLSAEREIRSNLSAGAALGLGYRDYAGLSDHDVALNAEASLTWWMNRYAGIRGRYRYEQLDSTRSGRDYRINSAYLGLILQR